MLISFCCWTLGCILISHFCWTWLLTKSWLCRCKMRPKMSTHGGLDFDYGKSRLNPCSHIYLFVYIGFILFAININISFLSCAYFICFDKYPYKYRLSSFLVSLVSMTFLLLLCINYFSYLFINFFFLCCCANLLKQKKNLFNEPFLY